MSIELPDVNVLVALFDRQHQFYAAAKSWFDVSSEREWATCPITENGFIRVVTSPAYPSLDISADEAAARLQGMIETTHRPIPSGPTPALCAMNPCSICGTCKAIGN